jgi:hypothetical protein
MAWRRSSASGPSVSKARRAIVVEGTRRLGSFSGEHGRPCGAPPQLDTALDPDVPDASRYTAAGG